jgi:hypothetical protein
MKNDEAVRRLFAACRVGGVDAEKVFQHYDTDDIDSYREALERGWIDSTNLPKWMRSTAATIASGRCLCRTCLRERGVA